MASELYVETLKGLTSGANANKVIIPSGQTLDITDWSPPAGTVLQVASASTTTEFSINSANNVNCMQVTFTAKSTNSKLMCFAQPRRFVVYSGNEVRPQFLDSNGNNSDGVRITSSGGIDLYYPPHMFGLIQGTHSAGDSVTVTFVCKRSSGANTNIVGDNGSNSYIWVQEIAG